MLRVIRAAAWRSPSSLAIIMSADAARAQAEGGAVRQDGATITGFNAVCRQNTQFAVGNLAHLTIFGASPAAR